MSFPLAQKIIFNFIFRQMSNEDLKERYAVDEVHFVEEVLLIK